MHCKYKCRSNSSDHHYLALLKFNFTRHRFTPKLTFVFLKIANGFDLISSNMLFASFIKHTKQKIEDTAGK